MGERRGWSERLHPKPLVLLVATALIVTLVGVVAPLPAFAAGTALFDNKFINNTVDGTGTVTKPIPSSGTNVACLTASGNAATPPLLSCSGNIDTQGTGKLRLTGPTTNQVGGVFGSTSFPSSNGLDVTFNAYQWGGGFGGDGIAFVLAAVDPANPTPPATIGTFGAGLGYSGSTTVNGLANGYLGIGLDVFGDYSTSLANGTGCSNPATISGSAPGAVVVRGPGAGTTGYCGLTTTYDGTSTSLLSLRAPTRTNSLAPVQVLVNPTAVSYTSGTGVSVAAGTYKVVVTTAKDTARTLTGSLPPVASTLYPSATWLSASGVPKQLAFGFASSTGARNDIHEVSDVKVWTFNAVPQLSISATSYSLGTPQPGGPVNYVLTPSVQVGTNETSPISVTQTVPTGVTPVGAYGVGWVCQTPVGQTITCTTSGSSFSGGTTLPVINVVAIVTGSGITSSVIQNSSVTRVSSSDANPATVSVMAAGAVPTSPTGVTASPTIGPTAGGGAVTLAGSNITAATAIEIGTSGEQQAGTPVVLLPCPGAAAAGCFTVSGSTLVISSMPARAGSVPLTVTVVTLGVAGTTSYTYANKPAAPATPTATAGLSGATVTWAAPVDNGSAISGYVVTPYKAGVAQPTQSFDATATTGTLSPLTAGASYTFTVAAVNAVGTSTASSPSVAVVPYNVPGAPTITAASAGDNAATLTWSAPSANGSTISGYVVTPYLGGVAQGTQTFASTATTQSVTGLTAGTAYTFTVAATNTVGTGPASAASSAVVPNSSPTLVFGPPPPAAVGVAYSQQLTVTAGTSPFVWSVSAGTLPAGMTLSSSGLLSGTPTVVGNSTLTVRVVDASGQSATQSVTLVVTDKPAAPAAPTATAGLTSAVLTWVAPASNNSTITSYRITPHVNGVAQTVITVDPSAKTRTLNGLTVGGSYTFTIAATNSTGTSTASGLSNAVIPYAALSAPAITATTAGSTSATLTWTAPSSTGGSPITGFVITPYIGAVAQAPQTFNSTATTQTVTGLTGGTTYTFQVAAMNLSGTTILYRFAGGPAVTAIDGGPTWAADTGSSSAYRNSGSAYSTFGAIAGMDTSVPSTAPSALFSTERYDPTGGTEMQYAIPVTAGASVKVRLYLTNQNGSTAFVGGRVFDVALEGTMVLPSFDPVAAAGANQTGTMREFAITSDGTVNIDFTHGPASDPVIYGIEIIQIGMATTGPPSASSSAVTPNASPSLTFAAPPGGRVGVAYSTQLTVNGGTAPFVWSVSAGTLPAGISMSSSGLLSGAPTVVGSSTFTVQVVDWSSQTATKSVTLVVIDKPAAPVITAATAADSAANLSWTVPASNGSALTGFVVTPYIGATAQATQSFGGSTTSAAITGLTAGTSYTFTVAAQNAAGTGPASAASSAVVPNASPTLVFAAPPPGPVGVSYSTQLTVTGGTSPFTWSVSAGTLPAGITLSSAGLLSGTPTVVGSTTFTVQVFDGSGQTATKSVTFVTTDRPATPAAPTATAGVTSATVTWVAPVNNGSALTGYIITPYKAGVAQTAVPFDATATTRTLSGLAPAVSYTFTVAAGNAAGTSAESAQSASVMPYALPAAPSITSATAATSSAVLSWTVPANNGSALTGYVVTSYIGATAQATQPFSSSTTTATITGLTAGTSYTFTVAAQNAAGTGPASAASSAVVPNASPTLSFAAPPGGRVGVAYSNQLVVSAGTSPFTWSVSAGTLPPGIALSSSGLLSGTPTAVGSTTFTVRVVDASAQTATQPVTFVVIDRPAAPSITGATAADSGATLSWTVPANNGSAITGYLVTPYIGATAQTQQPFGGSTTTASITGLTPGTSYTFTVAAQNVVGTGPASTASAVVIPNAAPSLAFAAPPPGPVGVPYSTQLTVTGGTSPFTWSVTTGSLPAGIALSTSGLLSGTPTVVGSSTFTVRVLDASGLSATQSVTLVVTDRPATPAAPAATAGITSATVSWSAPANNGSTITSYLVTPYKASVAQTPVSFDASTTTRTLSGLTAAVSYTFSIMAVNAAGTSPESAQSGAVTPYAVPAAPVITSAAAGDSSATLSWSAPATNGSAITGYVVTPFIGATAQPTQSFSGATTTATIISLTPGTSYTFTVAAQNAAGTGPASAASAVVVPNASPTLTFAAPPGGRVGVAYSTQLTVTGGTSPYVWSVSAGSLPAGISMSSSGLLSGTPTVVGSSTFTVQVVDWSGQAATKSVTLVVIDKPVVPAAPTATAGVTSATVSWSAPATNGSPLTGYVVTPYKVGVAQAPVSFDASSTTRILPGLAPAVSYTFTVAATNAVGTSTESAPSAAVTPYALPAAPSITSATPGTSSAVLSWTVPANNGSALTGYVVTPFIGATAQPTQSFSGATTTATIISLTPGTSYTFTVAAQNAAGTGPASGASPAVVPNASPTLTFAAPPAGEVAVAYSNLLVVTGGTSPFTWSVLSGSLPAGLTLNATSGLLSGTPTTAGNSTFTVKVVDASGQNATKAVTLVIAATPTVTFSPAAGEVGVAYSQQPTTSGGTGPFSWAITAGALPAGVTINTSTGLVSGTPTASGSFSVTVSATDSFSQVATKTANVVIIALPTLTFSAPPAGQVGIAYSTTLTAAGGKTPLAWSISAGSLPAGLALNTTNGVVSGTPTTVGSFSFTATVTDANSQVANKAVTLVIGAGPLVITKTANATSTVAGGVVSYTVVVSNTSTTAFTGVTLSDPLTGVLDDAVYNANASATTGSVTYAAPTISWTGDLAANGSATITYGVTVNTPDAGNKVLANTVSSTTLGTNCAGGSGDTRCAAAVTVSGLSIVKTADVATTTPGSVVRFSILVTNNGQTGYVGASLTDTLADVLDDATYNGDASTTAGSVSYTSPSLDWTGNLAVGASATITYTVTVTNPDPGNKSLTGTVVSSAAGSPCPSGNPATSCTVAVTVLVPSLVISTTANVSTTTPGSAVGYTVTLSNTGQTPYTGTSVAIDFTGTLDDATYNSDATATAGAVAYNAGPGTLVWTGDLAIGAVVTITASVTVRDPDPGDRALTAVASSAAAGNTCPGGSSNSACTSTVQVLVPQLSITKAADVASSIPGAVVIYTVSVTNTGQTNYVAAAWSDSLTGVLDDADYDGDAVASAGAVAYGSPNLTWSGDLAIGATATITYSVTVHKPDTGDFSLTNRVTSSTAGTSCPAASIDPRCVSTVPVLLPGLNITNTADVATTTPGAVVTYAISVANTGQTTYTNVAVDLNFSGVYDDATYNNDGVTTAGDLVVNADGSVQWVLTLAPGQSATGTTSFTANSPAAGDKTMVMSVRSDAPGSTCPTGTANPSCGTTVTVLIPGLTITKTANTASVTPGETVGYTILVVNTGQTTYPAASFDDSLAVVLDEATYPGGATATSGTVSYSAPTLSWTGALAPGASATIGYVVTVRDPDTGDKQLSNRVVSSATGSNCASTSTDARCSATVNVLVPGLTISTTANAVTTQPGAVVGYTVTVTNSGATAYTGAAFSDSLTGVLDDATYNSDVATTAGTVGYASSTVSWSGDLAVGASATVTYSVTVHTATGGDNLLTNTVTSATRNSNCAAGSPDTRCAVTVPLARLVISQSYTEATTTPGSLIHLTGTFTNTGQVPYEGITISSASADTVDDALPTGDQVATSGTLELTASAIVWTGNIPVGGVVTVTGTLTVKNPDPANKIITGTLVSSAVGNNCPSGGSDSRCTAVSTVLLPGLTVSKSASASTADPGATVGYTITVLNSGQTAYAPASVTDSLTGILDDATYNNNAVASIGSVSLAGQTLSWSGALAVGQTATISYSVTVLTADTADKRLSNGVISNDVGSSCPTANGNAACRTMVLVLTPGLTLAKTADVGTATLGSAVNYTVTVTNSGQTSYPSASFTDALAGVLDDAAFTAGSVTASLGTASYASGVLSWSGALAVGQSAVVHYAVSVNNPASGNGSLSNQVSSTSAGANCATGSTDTRCAAVVTVVNSVALTFTKTADVAATAAGKVVRFTISAANGTGSALTGVEFTAPMAGTLDDADYNADATATAGAVNFTSPNLTWTGTVPAGATVTVTFSVTVHAAVTGDQLLMGTIFSSSLPGGNNCAPGSTDVRCSMTVPVARLVIVQEGPATTTPGSTIRFTVTFTNAGKLPFSNIAIPRVGPPPTDDALPNGDQTATSGTFTVSETGASWIGSIPVGGVVTITGTFTVKDPDTGDKVLTESWQSDALGSNCPSGGTDPACTSVTRVLIPALTISKTADRTVTAPGGAVAYTIIVNNTGETPYVGASVTDSLAGVLDDGVYNANASSTAGTVSYSAPTLTWTGDLAVGQTATITYAVTSNAPATGDKNMANRANSNTVGNTCPAASGSTACRANVLVLTPSLTITSAVNAATTVPGAVVGYTLTVFNSGQTSYANALVSAPLTGLLDDATYGGNGAASSGAVALAGANLNWTGALAPGATATITFSVTVNDPVAGDHVLSQTLVSTAAGSTCPAGGNDTRCSTSVEVASLHIVNIADVAQTKPTGRVSYTTTFTNTGQVPYVGISIVDLFAGALDDATVNGDQNATSGSLAFSVGSGFITWTGDLPVGATVTVTGSLTVRNPDPADKTMTTRITTNAVGSNCPTAGSDPLCSTSVTVLTPGLTITKAADRPTVTPGGTVAYTVTVANSGQTTYTAARVTDSLSDVLSEATLVGSPQATTGTVGVVDTLLTWTGDLAPGQSATISYSVVVRDPDPGDKSVVNAAVSDELGSSCPTGGSAPACSSQVDVLVPRLDITVTADRSTTTPGGIVGYTVTVVNSGETAYPGATVTTALAGVLDDATYDNNGAATVGSVSFAETGLTWTGDLAVGATATITYSVTVNVPDNGNRLLTTSISSAAAGSTCTPAAPCVNNVTVLIPGLAVSTSTDVTTATPGDAVDFTITITNTGQTPFTNTVVTSSLSDVLDDATLESAVNATSGVVSYTAPNLSWTGSLAVGESATITYGAVVNQPVAGNHLLRATVVASAAGSNCPSGSDNTSCTASVTVLIPALTITKSAGAPTTTPGSTVGYTIVVTNSGETAYPSATVNDTLAHVLPEAAYNADAQVTGGGTLSYAAPTLTWVGNLPIGASATITYSVTVRAAGSGDGMLHNGVTSSAARSSCPPGNTVGACSTDVRVLIPALVVTKTADTASVVAGSPVRYTVTLTNTGETDYAPATFTDTLAGVLDDASYAGDATATAGTVTYAGNTLSWSGPLAMGATATVTYSVTSSYPALGDLSLANTVVSSSAGANCANGSGDARCSASVTVLVPALTITKTADTNEVVGGGVVHYTIQATNNGQSDYPAASLSDPLAGILDDAVYNADVTATRGTVSYAGGTLGWSGALAIGQSVTITFSVGANLIDTGDKVLTNRVLSTAVGNTCTSDGVKPACSTSTAVADRTIALSGLTPSFTLVGAPRSTVSKDGAVSMTVTTNSTGGYAVTVQARSTTLAPQTAGNTDSIPIDQLSVRDSSSALFVPISMDQLLVHRQDSASKPTGDSVVNDYQVAIPFVASDTYSGTLDYIVTAQ